MSLETYGELHVSSAQAASTPPKHATKIPTITTIPPRQPRCLVIESFLPGAGFYPDVPTTQVGPRCWYVLHQASGELTPLGTDCDRLTPRQEIRAAVEVRMSDLGLRYQMQ